MKKIFDSVIKSISEFFKKLSRKEKIRLGVLAGVIITLSIVVAAVLGRTSYGTAFTALDTATAGEITAELTALGIPYKTEGSSSITILVPEEQVTSARMQLAQQGYLSTGFDYSMFSTLAGGFGATDMEKQYAKLSTLEYNVGQQVMTIDYIKDCLVKINLPETSSFVLSNDTDTASATVTLTPTSGKVLSDSEFEAIAHIVAGGTTVPLENVCVVDNTGKLYTVGGSDSTGSASHLAYQLDLENRVRNQFESQVVSLLESVFGEGHVRASVAVTLSFDKETVNSVEFAPPVDGMEEGLVVSMTELYEYTRDETAGGVVGTDVNGLGTPEYPFNNEDGYDYYHIAREFNYEINETVTQIEKAQATVASLAISVLVDSVSITEDYTDIVQDVVVNAIGVNENHVTVARLPFQPEAPDPEREARDAAIKRQQLMELIQLVLKGLVVLMLVIAVISFLRTLLKGLFPQEEPTLAAAGMSVGTVGEGFDYVADDDISSAVFEDELPEIDLNAKSDTMSQLEKFIDKDSKAIAQLLRNWLSEEE